MRIRDLAWLSGIAVVVVYGWLAIRVYDARNEPVTEGAGRGDLAWIVGPPAGELTAAARDRVRRGLEKLNDTSLPAGDRISEYRDALGAAHALLSRSLRAQPAQARTVAQLAAIRWELAPPRSEREVRSRLETIELASALAPTVPGVQMQLGELLLRMARRDDALDYLTRAVELDAGTSPEVIRILRDHLFTASEILNALPGRAEVLAALWRPFREDGDESRYLRAVEEYLADPESRISLSLLATYGSSCLDLRVPRRLREGLEGLGEQTSTELESARLHQLSRASVALGEPGRALDEARAAVRLEPGRAHLQRHLGDVASVFGDPELAVQSYRHALRLIASGSGAPRARAVLYRRIGEAEERRGNPDRAYDNYRRALELDPDEPHARRRIEAMKSAAGLRSPVP